ncbi:MAG TPA: allantoate amidohydrolase [Candidatus Sulfopaludibacter sp.]|nr:allantoate amidohydrolase [Candidatus Sulfopaludibacter sp.]
MTGADEIIRRCRALAECTEEPGFTTRTFLSPPMRDVHAHVRTWMEAAGMSVRVDSAGNIRGVHPAASANAPHFFLGSHLDTVPRAGAFDGILGVVMAVALVEWLGGRRLPFAIEVIGFSEEDGVRFGVPFIGSRALVGDLDAALLDRISDAIRDFGLDPARIADAAAGPDAVGYLEFHIEQGVLLERLGLPLGVVEAIAGQSRLEVTFHGEANHAATPLPFRRDALAAAAEWIVAVEREAGANVGMVATVGCLECTPGSVNAIAGEARASLDVRHRDDAVRHRAVEYLVQSAQEIAQRRRLTVSWVHLLDRAAVQMDPGLTNALERALAGRGYKVRRTISGAGHDAMIVAARMPAAMLFLRSPGGVSHQPNEAVLPEDIAAALEVGVKFLVGLEAANA